MCGPINHTTRSVYSKKIVKFLNEKNQVKMGLKSEKKYFFDYSEDILRQTKLIDQEDVNGDEDELNYYKV